MFSTLSDISLLRSFINELGRRETLFIFDVDYVILIPEDKVFWPCSAEVSTKFSKLYLDALPENQRERLNSIILKDAKIRVLDENLPKLFSEVVAAKIKCIALTACDVGKKGIIENLEDWRCNQLDNLGFHFQNSFPQFPRIVLKHLPTRSYPYPVFQRGVLFSTDYSKGEALGAFLKEVDYVPQQIIFIDDRVENLHSVAQEAERWGIVFKGYHFKKAYELSEGLDEKIAEAQYRHLVKEERWLSELEAQTLAA